MRITPRKKHKKIIYKYIDLHMPVTRKGAGGANASARMRFSGPTTSMKERRRRDTRTQRAFASRDAKNELASMKPEAEEAREERERHRGRRSRADWIVRLRRERCGEPRKDKDDEES